MRARGSRVGLVGLAVGFGMLGLILSGCGGYGGDESDEAVSTSAARPMLAIRAGAYTAKDYGAAKKKVAKCKVLLKKKKRSEALRLYLEVLPVLRSFARTNRKRDACLELARAEHGLGGISLAQKNYGTAYIHYKNSVFYFEYGGWKQRARLSGSTGRVKEMKQKRREAIPESKRRATIPAAE